MFEGRSDATHDGAHEADKLRSVAGASAASDRWDLSHCQQHGKEEAVLVQAEEAALQQRVQMK